VFGIDDLAIDREPHARQVWRQSGVARGEQCHERAHGTRRLHRHQLALRAAQLAWVPRRQLVPRAQQRLARELDPAHVQDLVVGAEQRACARGRRLRRKIHNDHGQR